MGIGFFWFCNVFIGLLVLLSVMMFFVGVVMFIYGLCIENELGILVWLILLMFNISGVYYVGVIMVCILF